MDAIFLSEKIAILELPTAIVSLIQGSMVDRLGGIEIEDIP